ncbi:MAG TPA: biliverdin-producing heme oxygenase [Aliidongia sp.]|nr:biliverdin-producing heme oxygenase [Aliidongia sp.]
MHWRLRHATSDLHRSVDQAFDVEGLESSSLEYCRRLVKLHQIYTLVENALDAVDWADAGLDLAHRIMRVRWIEEDLAKLGCTPAAALAFPALCLSSLGEGLGCLYVIEGSTLGGRVIYKRVKARLGFDADHGARYFFGYGADTAEMWASFIGKLNSFGANTAIGADAEMAARRVFLLFEQAFRPAN